MRLILATTALATLLASPALAQDGPICGGISLVGQWVGGDETASDVLDTDGVFDFTGQVPIAGHLVSLFTLSQPGTVRIDVSAIPAGDPYIAVYDADGNEVGADDDSGGDFAASLVADLQPGTYCLASRSYESGVTDVSVQIGRPDAFPGGIDGGAPDAPMRRPVDAPGCDDPAVAVFADGRVTQAMLDTGTNVTATVGQAPAFAFDLDQATPLTITATSDLGDPLIRLRDPAGAIIAENDDFDGLNSRIDLTAPIPAGRYCVELEDLNGADNDITLAMRTFDPDADRRLRLDEMEFPPTTTDDVPQTDLGTLETVITTDFRASDAANWFTFDMPEGGLVLIEAVGSNVDPEIRLFDRVGREVAYSDDGPQGLDSFIVHRAQPGRFTLGARILDGGQTGTLRILLERYVPAR